MRLSKKITFGVAIITLLFVFAACTTPDSVGDTIEQADMEQEARETVSALNNGADKGDITALKTSLSDDFVYTTEDGGEGTSEDIEEYFQGDDLLYFRISEDGTVKKINDNEMRIYTVLTIGLKIEGLDVVEFETDITITLRKISGNWTITRWDEGHKDRWGQDDDEKYYDQAAIDATDKLFNDIFLAIIDRDRESLEDYLDSDFEYEGPAFDGRTREVEYDRAEFINKVLADEIVFKELDLKNRKYEMDDDDEVEIEGYLKIIFEYNGEEYNKSYYKAEFEFEKDNGTWYLEEWEKD